MTEQLSQEQIYDQKIRPFMDQVFAICREHSMPFIATFICPDHNDPDLRCTSLYTGPELIGSQGGLKQAAIILGAPVD